MPVPIENESEDAFVSRCIPIVYDEGGISSPEHAAAKCHGIYRQHKKKGLLGNGNDTKRKKRNEKED